MSIKGGEFLVKKTEDIFIPEEFTEEQKMLRDTAKDFIDREVAPQRVRFEQKDYAFTKEIMEKLGELGFLSMAIPSSYNGMGMGFVSTMIACDYLSGISGSLATAYGAHTGIGTMPIVFYGNEEQKKKYLPDIAVGSKFCSYCLTEPGAGSDANAGKTKAVLSEDGKYYEITGQKMWISNASFASIFIVFAKIDNDKRLSAFILDYDPAQPNGLTLGEEEHKLGIRSSSTRQVFFNKTKVPIENMLGKREEGFKIALNVLNVGRVKLGAGTIDAQRRIIEHAVKYANERVQFGVPIAQFEAIQFKLAEIFTNIYVCESACYRAGKNIEDRAESHQQEGLSHEKSEMKAFEEFAAEAAILKIFVSECVQYAADEGIQIFGGMGFSEETPMESSWRDARIPRIYEGTNEINRLLVVDMLLKKALKGEIDFMTPATEVAQELVSIPSFETPDYTEPMAQELTMIENLRKVVLMIAGSATQKYMAELEHHQFLLTDISNMIIALYTAESAVLRTRKLIVQNGESNTKIQIAIAQLNLFNAVEKVTNAGKNALYSFVEGDEQRVMLIGLKRFTKYHMLPNPYELRKRIAQHVIEKGVYIM